jgi:sulfur-oxidizing protein SoxA
MIQAFGSLAISFFLFTHSALADSRQSGYQLLSPANQAMQNDMNLNPALFAVMDGEALWQEKSQANGKSCASCHGDFKQSMRGVFATYPKIMHQKLQNMEGQINACRTRHQRLPEFAYESKPMLALSTLIALQSRGLPIQATPLGGVKKEYELGKTLYFQRIGQLNLSCAQCHDDRAGLKLGGSVIPQAHPTGYPIYRIEWQGMGSLQRRLRNCLSGVRAESYAYGSNELLQMELYLMHRANGMIIESPAIRP